jgi:hypothetical protein
MRERDELGWLKRRSAVGLGGDDRDVVGATADKLSAERRLCIAPSSTPLARARKTLQQIDMLLENHQHVSGALKNIKDILTPRRS